MLIITRPHSKALKTQAKATAMCPHGTTLPRIERVPLTALKPLPLLHSWHDTINPHTNFIFTSSASVKFWLTSMHKLPLSIGESAATRSFWVVGEKTAELLNMHGFNLACSAFLDAKSLFHYLSQNFSCDNLKNINFVYLCAKHITVNPQLIMPNYAERFTLHPIYQAQARTKLKAHELLLFKHAQPKTVLIYSQRNAELFSAFVKLYNIKTDSIRVIAISQAVGAYLARELFPDVRWPDTAQIETGLIGREEAMLQLYYNSS